MDTYANTTLWDCGSTLYDSFELKSFNLRLNSAIANSPRTLSMSCLPERRAPIIQPQPLPQPQPHASKKPFNISRSLHKLLRSVFKLNNNNNNNNNNNKSTVSTSSMISSSFVQVPEKYSNDNKERFYVVYDKSGGPVLSTIPEVPEFEIAASAALSSSEEISSSFVSRSASERFAATTAIGISCP